MHNSYKETQNNGRDRQETPGTKEKNKGTQKQQERRKKRHKTTTKKPTRK